MHAKLFTLTIIGLLFATPVQAQPRNFNGPTGAEITIKDGEIGYVDGPGHWIIWGVGQDLRISQKKDGEGSLTLHGFRNIYIEEKNGQGTLVIAGDNESVTIGKVDGPGNVHLHNKALNTIEKKNGGGNVLFTGRPPVVNWKDGPGDVRRE